MSSEPVTTETQKPTGALVEKKETSLITKMATRYGVEPEKLANTLKATCFSISQKDKSKPAQVPNNEQLMALLVVADQYGLNPFTREIYAFPKDGGIVPIVGVDGWIRITNDHPQLDGFTFDYGPIIEPSKDDNGNTQGLPVFEWVECTVYRKDRQHPTKAREYIVECRKDSIPWSTHPRRMLRHKALMQATRMAFGFAGIYDADEGATIAAGEYVDVTPKGDTTTLPANGTTRLRATKGTVVKPKEDKKDEEPVDVEVTKPKSDPLHEEVDENDNPVTPAPEENKPAPEPEKAEATLTNKQIMAKFNDFHPKHVRSRMTTKNKINIVRCECGGAWDISIIGQNATFPKMAGASEDGSCEQMYATKNAAQEPTKTEPAPAAPKATGDLANIMELSADDLSQFFEETLKKAGKAGLRERRELVPNVGAMVRRKLALATSPIMIQHTIQWLTKSNFVLTMDHELLTKIQGEINDKSKTFNKA